jgi:uncharacterized protein with PIN domain
MSDEEKKELDTEEILRLTDEVASSSTEELKKELVRLRTKQRREQMSHSDLEKAEAVLQCYRCGKQIDQGDQYADIAICVDSCPSHEDYLEFNPVWEEYFCDECHTEILKFINQASVPTIKPGGKTT